MANTDQASTQQEAAAFTPGPWRVEEVGSGGDYDNPVPVCEVLSERSRICEYVSEPNARLIAAAPELYDAADNALNALIGCCVPADGVDDRKTMLEAQAMLRAALSLARGS